MATRSPGVNGVAQQFSDALPTVWSQEDRIFVQAEFEGELKRASLWGMDRSATSAAVDAFVINGFLDELLTKIWRWRTGVLV